MTKTVCFDVDGTLVDNVPFEYGSLFWTPGATDNQGRRWVTPYAREKPEVVAKLVEHFEMGHRIVVWSWGGDEWARKVTDGLGLEHMVSLCGFKGWWQWAANVRRIANVPLDLPLPDIVYDDNFDNNIGPPVQPREEFVVVAVPEPQWVTRFDDDVVDDVRTYAYRGPQPQLYGLHVDWMPYRGKGEDDAVEV